MPVPRRIRIGYQFNFVTAEIDVIGALQNLSSEQLERVMAAYRKHQGIV